MNKKITRQDILEEIDRQEKVRQELVDTAKFIDPTGQFACAFTDTQDQAIAELTKLLEQYPN